MVFVHKVEFDKVANRCLNGIRRIHITGRASHGDLEQILG